MLIDGLFQTSSYSMACRAVTTSPALFLSRTRTTTSVRIVRCHIVNPLVDLVVANRQTAGGDAWACDGCDAAKSIAEWDISRFELDDNPERQGGCMTSGCVGGLSESHDIYLIPSISLIRNSALYGTGGGTYGLESTLAGHQGDCQRTSADEVGPCDAIATSAVQLFHCTTALTASDISGN